MEHAEQRNVNVPLDAREEWRCDEPGRHAGDAGGKQARPEPVLRMYAQARLHPQHSAGHVLHDDAGRHRQAADESAAGRIMAAQQEIHGHKARDWQQHATDRCLEPQVPGGQAFARGKCLARGILPLRTMRVAAFRRGSESAQQGVNGQRDRAQDRDFTQRVETRESRR